MSYGVVLFIVVPFLQRAALQALY